MKVNEQLLCDTLRCTSLVKTRGNRRLQSYARGVIGGLIAGLRACDIPRLAAEALVVRHLPADKDPVCVLGWSALRLLKQGRFKVHEHFNGYELEDTVTKKRHWLSDGVDCVALDDSGKYLSPGTPGFIELWEADFNSNESETLEAYFSKT